MVTLPHLSSDSSRFFLGRCWLVVGLLFLASCTATPRGGAFYQQQPTAYKVQSKDTLNSIGYRYGVPPQQIARSNNLQAPYVLKRGQWLKIPGTGVHTVQRGESLYSISRRYNTSIAALAGVNNLNPPYNIYPNQRLKVVTANYKPSKSSRRAPTKAKSAKKTTAKKQPVKKVTPPSRKFANPVPGKIISRFGSLGKGEKNEGINIAAAAGTPVRSVDKGTVAYAGNEIRGYGNLVLIKHTGGWISTYAHLQNISVKKGQAVSRGQGIGTVGSTGSVKSPQLHFELRAGKRSVDPERYLTR